jgi:hypothetical protein
MTEELMTSAGREFQHCAVLGDDHVEAVQIAKQAPEVGELPPGGFARPVVWMMLQS